MINVITQTDVKYGSIQKRGDSMMASMRKTPNGIRSGETAREASEIICLGSSAADSQSASLDFNELKKSSSVSAAEPVCAMSPPGPSDSHGVAFNATTQQEEY